MRAAPGVDWAEPAGLLRRGHETIDELTLVASTRDRDLIRQLLDELPPVTSLRDAGGGKTTIRVDSVEIALHVAKPATAGTTLLRLTGSAAHLHALDRRANEMALPDAATETKIYEALRLPYIPPEIREDGEEVEIAARGELPLLVSRGDIRGDLHMHSTWSDGRDSIEAMARASRALGYEYIAITDHSPSSAATRSLSNEDVARQADEIEDARAAVPGITILHGCEADILPDGRLDFPDEILERFDLVLASLHDHAGHSRGRLMRRYEMAMRHPLVAMITHPANRMVPYREGYDLDYGRLFELAVETGTLLEIDGAPGHLDLDGPLARRATAAGVTVAIDGDTHRAELLDRHMRLGVVTARRGWVEPRHVLNTRPLDHVLAVIAAKRER